MCEMEFLSQFRPKTDTLLMCRSTLIAIKKKSFNEIAHKHPPHSLPKPTIIRN